MDDNTERMTCHQASEIIKYVMNRVNPDRRVDLLLWAAHQFDPYGRQIGQQPSDSSLPQHMDCEYYDECHGTVLMCRKQQD